MLDHVRKNGIVWLDDGPDGITVFDSDCVKKFFKIAEQAECLVFHPKNKEPTDVCEKYGDDVYVEFSSPFSNFSFEVLNGNITEPHGYREKMKALSDAPAAFVPGEAEAWYGEDVDCWIHCILASEATPNIFSYYVYATVRDKPVVFNTNTLNRLTKEFVERVNRESLGSESVRQRVKVGVGGDKRTHTIRRIVHVVPTRYKDKTLPIMGNEVSFSHRFVRRGTWRTHPGGIGKDRAGNYCVSNFTWVSETIVGPEDKPIIRKTRVVNEDGSLPKGPR